MREAAGKRNGRMNREGTVGREDVGKVEGSEKRQVSANPKLRGDVGVHR